MVPSIHLPPARDGAVRLDDRASRSPAKRKSARALRQRADHDASQHSRCSRPRGSVSSKRTSLSHSTGASDDKHLDLDRGQFERPSIVGVTPGDHSSPTVRTSKAGAFSGGLSARTVSMPGFVTIECGSTLLVATDCDGGRGSGSGADRLRRDRSDRDGLGGSLGRSVNLSTFALHGVNSKCGARLGAGARTFLIFPAGPSRFSASGWLGHGQTSPS